MLLIRQIGGIEGCLIRSIFSFHNQEGESIKMGLYQQIRDYKAYNEQEEQDKRMMLQFIERNKDYLDRTNEAGHFSVSAWVVNPDRTKVLMIYHNIYKAWSWIGGHADGEEDLKMVVMRELTEETGVKQARLVSEAIFSLESLTVDGHEKRGKYVPSHLHLNVTYLIVAQEDEGLVVKPDENSGVQWFETEKALAACEEEWMVERIYRKLVEKSQKEEWGG